MLAHDPAREREAAHVGALYHLVSTQTRRVDVLERHAPVDILQFINTPGPFAPFPLPGAMDHQRLHLPLQLLYPPVGHHFKPLAASLVCTFPRRDVEEADAGLAVYGMAACHLTRTLGALVAEDTQKSLGDWVDEDKLLSHRLPFLLHRLVIIWSECETDSVACLQRHHRKLQGTTALKFSLFHSRSHFSFHRVKSQFLNTSTL